MSGPLVAGTGAALRRFVNGAGREHVMSSYEAFPEGTDGTAQEAGE